MFEPFQYEFFVRGLIAATIVGGLLGMLGVYVVLRRMAYIGHGLAHAVFGGAAVSWILSVNFFLGATLWGFVSALLITLTARRRTIGADAAIGIITTASFALGIALISRVGGFVRSFEAALFGNILGVGNDDVVAIVVVTLIAAAFVFAAYKQLLFATFDPEVADFYGVRTGRIDAAFSLVLAAAIVVSMQVVGVTLIAAAIVIPPIVARLVTNSFRRVMVISVIVGCLTGLAGIYLSFYIDVSSGASIVLLASGVFVAALAYASLSSRFRARRGGRNTEVVIASPDTPNSL